MLTLNADTPLGSTIARIIPSKAKCYDELHRPDTP